MINWLQNMKRNDDAGSFKLLRRWFLTILLMIFLGIPAFGWIQYRQAYNLERLTAQSFSSFEWDAFKLEVRLLALREALLQILIQPGSASALANLSTEYGLFSAEVLLIENGISHKAMDDQLIYQTVLNQALAFLKRADPVLENVETTVDNQSLKLLFDESSALLANTYRLAQQAHDIRALRSIQTIKEVENINYYFAALSSVAVILGVGWALSAVRSLRLSTQHQQELNGLYLKSNFNASHDFLTGLANRRMLYEQLQQAIGNSKRSGNFGALMMIDLDNFKPVNDSYGHEAGDRVLTEAAERMKNCVRDVDTVARLGGDEFAVLLAQIEGQKDQASEAVGAISQKLLVRLSAPYMLIPSGKCSPPDALSVVCTASLGVCLFCKDGLTAEQIIRTADAAMYRVKQSGGNQFELAA